ncbi:MAG: rhomboid family intramembrane serine protease [Candidatus Undinarchaeales archaeon]
MASIKPKNIQHASLWLVGICFVVFGIQSFVPGFTDMFLLNSSLISSRPWTLLTSIFLHGGVEHLLYNMFALALFGYILEKLIGTKRFLILFFTAGLFASVGAAFFYDAALGASGAIMGVLGALAVLKPKMKVFVGMVPMPMIMAAVVWAAGDLLRLFVPSNIASAAHLFGMALGISVGVYLRHEYGLLFKDNHSRDENEEFDEEFQDWEDSWM